MKRAKKDRPKAGTFEQSRPGLAPRTIRMNIITFLGENASPNLDGEGGAFPVTLELVLMTIGTAWLTRQLFRVIDWIEGQTPQKNPLMKGDSYD